MSKRIAMISLVLMLVLTMVAPIAAQDEPAPEPTPIVASIGDGDLNISFWNGLTGSDGETLNEMLGQFVAENPSIAVTTEIVEWNTLYTKLQAAFVAGNPPDVFVLHSAEIPQFGSYGVLRDLSDWYAAGGGWLAEDDLSEITYNAMLYEGAPHGIPLDNHGRGVWINPDHFAAAGLDVNMDVPTTYEGWVELFQQLTLDANGNNAASPEFDAENVVQWGYSVEEWMRVNFISVLAQHGGALVSEDGTTVTVNDEAGITALQQTYDLVYKYHVAPVPAGFDSWQAFANGTLSIVPSGTWFRNFAATTEVDAQAWPQVQWGPEPGTYIGLHVWLVPASLDGEKLAAVETLVRWVTENQVLWAASGQVPALLSAQAALDPENYPSNILLGDTFSAYGVLDYPSIAIQEMYAALDPELNAALNNLKTPEEALNDAAARMQQVLDRSQ